MLAGNLPWGGEEVRGKAGAGRAVLSRLPAYEEDEPGVIKNAEFGAISGVDNVFFWLLWKREKTELAEKKNVNVV